MTSSQISLPGFSAQQVSSLTVLIQHVLDQAFKQHFGPLPPQQKQSVITPKPAQPSEQEQKHKPLQQATAENIAEKIMEKNKSMDSSSPIQAGTLSTIEHQATMHNCGEPSSRLSNTPVFATPLASLLTSLLALASPPDYIRFAKDMEAIGQG
ncbi:hypothetical protein HO173_005334 [Letharia columbiana]|uniref:Uncharacterized protein n=1 Tax=Letharia columbiana TaxID=112416 RepID=A0A8H6L5S6_9LECA|nr:uncharacterized protein HO173_005334 [Letharia columbiana]KAF6236553.1 hypothetical protein HO173_005334 [Letharia columbiana]